MSESQTLLIIVDEFWPDRMGGIAKSLINEVEGLVAADYDIVVLTRKLERKYSHHESRDGYELYRYHAPPTESRWYHLYPLYTLWRLPKTIDQLHRSYDFDLAYVHNPIQSIGLQRADCEIPEIYTYHAPMAGEITIEADQGKYGWKTPLARGAAHVFERIERHVVDSADRVLARSQYMCDEMETLHGPVNTAEILPLAVDTDRFAFEQETDPVRTELDLPAGRPILVTFRRLKPRVGLDLLIDAMVSVVDEHPDALLLIGGKGYLRDTLERQVQSLGLEDNVRFLGFVPEAELPTYYAAADCSVVPTKELEGFGLSTIESLSCGTPVVATPVGANPEVLGEFDQRLVSEEPTADAIAATLTQFLSQDPDVRQEQRSDCREYCVDNFSQQTVTEQLGDLFSAVEREY